MRVFTINPYKLNFYKYKKNKIKLKNEIKN